MINWLWQSALWFSCFALILLVNHGFLLRYLGARTTYSLWLLLPITLILPLLPTIPSNNSVLVIQQWLVSPHTMGNNQSLGNAIYYPVVIWMVGFCGVLAWCIASYLQLTRRLNANRGFTLGKLRCFRLSNTGPAIFGIFHPTLLIPSDFKQRFTKQERHLILQHERAHWQAGDLYSNVVALLLLATFWFSPITWLAYRRFRADQELACDARVLQQTPTVLVCYANALLAAMQSVSSAAQTNLLSPHYGATKHMTERLNNLTKQKGLHKQPLILSLSIMILLAMSLQPSTATQTANSATLTGEMATPIVRIAPRYPASAAQQGITGWVQLGYTIDSNGMVEQPKVLAAHPEGVFNEEALRAVSKWRYSPKHAGSSITVELKFALDHTTNQ